MGQGKLPLRYTVCIDDLIGPKLKAAGIKCPCPRCSPEGPETAETGKSKMETGEPEEEALLDRPPGPRRIPFDAIRDGTEKEDD
jgi:hypothetical protein